MHAAQDVAPRTPSRARSLRAAFAGFVTMLLLTASFPSGAAGFVEREYAEAVRSFKAGRTSEAFGQFIDLANRGDVDSARIALFMHTYGAVLFNKQWEAGAQDVAYWNTLVRNSPGSGRPPLEYQPTVLVPSRAKAKAAPARARMPAAANVLVSAD